MKMDIEGSEYLVLPKLLEKGLFCKGIIDVVFIEWHDTYVDDGEKIRLSVTDQLTKGANCKGRRPT